MKRLKSLEENPFYVRHQTPQMDVLHSILGVQAQVTHGQTAPRKFSPV